MNNKFELPVHSPIVPAELSLEDEFQFNCHKGIACFNQCCKSIDIPLLPYDIARLRTRLGVNSQEFLHLYTVPFQMDGQGMPGVKMRTLDDSTACPFLTDDGCSVYEDRPTACRYYALGQMSKRVMNSSTDETSYFVVKEEHCLGHAESKKMKIKDYLKEQGLEQYDEANRGWRQVVLKKKSSGPVIGAPSKRSLQLFFMASYDIDGFKSFIQSEGFQKIFKIDESRIQEAIKDDLASIQLAADFMKMVLFGESTLVLDADAASDRGKHRSDAIEARRSKDKDSVFTSDIDKILDN